MKIVSSSSVLNIAGKVERVAKEVHDNKKINTTYEHAVDYVTIPAPRIDSINNLVIVNDILERYA